MGLIRRIENGTTTVDDANRVRKIIEDGKISPAITGFFLGVVITGIVIALIIGV